MELWQSKSYLLFPCPHLSNGFCQNVSWPSLCWLSFETGNGVLGGDLTVSGMLYGDCPIQHAEFRNVMLMMTVANILGLSSLSGL